MNPILLRIAAMSAAVGIAAWLTDIRCSGPLSAVAVGALLSLAQIVIRPALFTVSLVAIRKVSLPLLVVFFLLSNMLIFWTVGTIVPGFHVEKFSSAFGGSIISGIAGFIIHSSLKRRFHSQTSPKSRMEAFFPQDSTPDEPQTDDGIKQAKGRVIR